MKTEFSVAATSLSQALTNEACPICRILKGDKRVLATKPQACWAG